jgi:hypothetical protein
VTPEDPQAPEPAPGPGQYVPQPAPPPPPQHPHAPLIVSQAPMRGAPRIEARPDRALLFTNGRGAVVRLDSHPNRLEALKYRLRYEVDMSRRHSVFETEVPSQTRATSFLVTLEVGWGVTDPVEIVRNGISDGDQIIRPRLLETVRSIGRDYPINEYADFEQHLNRRLGDRGPEYREGLGVFGCSARVRPDERHRRKIEEIDDLEHHHTVQTMRGGWVDHVDSEWSLLKEWLRRNPDNIPNVLAELRQRAESGNARDDERLRLLLDSGLVRDMADLETGMPIIQQPARFDPNDAIDRPRLTAEQVPPPPSLEPVMDEEEDTMPADIVEQPEDGVTGWTPAPWHQEDA